jgi:hypothetical protein
MFLLLRNNKAVPDSLANLFGSTDEYRYTLYKDLKSLKKLGKFPARYNNHLDLGKSKLLQETVYEKPDSVLYIDRLPAEISGKKGYVYFYKYKNKKDDLTWKLATVGLVPQDPKVFEFDHKQKRENNPYYSSYNSRSGEQYKLDLTSFSDTKIKEDEPIRHQLTVALKKLLYSKRASATEFYEKDRRNDYDVSVSAYQE